MGLRTATGFPAGWGIPRPLYVHYLRRYESFPPIWMRSEAATPQDLKALTDWQSSHGVRPYYDEGTLVGKAHPSYETKRNIRKREIKDRGLQPWYLFWR